MSDELEHAMNVHNRLLTKELQKASEDVKQQHARIIELGESLSRSKEREAGLEDQVQSLTRELQDEKDKTVVYRHVPDAKKGECDCYYCLKAMFDALEAREREQAKEIERLKADGVWLSVSQLKEEQDRAAAIEAQVQSLTRENGRLATDLAIARQDAVNKMIERNRLYARERELVKELDRTVRAFKAEEARAEFEMKRADALQSEKSLLTKELTSAREREVEHVKAAGESAKILLRQRDEAEARLATSEQKGIHLEAMNRQAESRIGFLEGENRKQFEELALLTKAVEDLTQKLKEEQASHNATIRDWTDLETADLLRSQEKRWRSEFQKETLARSAAESRAAELQRAIEAKGKALRLALNAFEKERDKRRAISPRQPQAAANGKEWKCETCGRLCDPGKSWCASCCELRRQQCGCQLKPFYHKPTPDCIPSKPQPPEEGR